ncbi:MAG TPA: DUF5320 domain-containing protein [Spirochaetota bacterium]|nr:DUF5320 domain-containing protein [Spirochaetota bacterium]HPV41106.1 DUF5320 domain-containing protein [Spirochaetota bacterium]
MPRGDRTGPRGMGPMTGRGSGLCRGNDPPGYTGAVGGRFAGPRGMDGGFGGGRHGFCNFFRAAGLFPGRMRLGGNAVWSREDEEQLLKSQADRLNRSLDAVNKRLNKIGIDKDASR